MSDSGEKVSGEVAKDRSGKTDAVDPVENAAMARQDGAEVLHPPIAFGGAHNETAGKAHKTYDQGLGTCLERGEWGDPEKTRSQGACKANSTDEAFHGLIGTHGFCDGMSSKKLSGDILQNIAHLHDQYKKKHELEILSALAVARDLKHQKRGHVAHKIDRGHHAPLDARGAIEKAFRCPSDRGPHLESDECVDRDEYSKSAVPSRRNQDIVERQCDEN